MDKRAIFAVVSGPSIPRFLHPDLTASGPLAVVGGQPRAWRLPRAPVSTRQSSQSSNCSVETYGLPVGEACPLEAASTAVPAERVMGCAHHQNTRSVHATSIRQRSGALVPANSPPQDTNPLLRRPARNKEKSPHFSRPPVDFRRRPVAEPHGPHHTLTDGHALWCGVPAWQRSSRMPGKIGPPPTLTGLPYFPSSRPAEEGRERGKGRQVAHVDGDFHEHCCGIGILEYRLPGVLLCVEVWL